VISSRWQPAARASSSRTSAGVVRKNSRCWLTLLTRPSARAAWQPALQADRVGPPPPARSRPAAPATRPRQDTPDPKNDHKQLDPRPAHHEHPGSARTLHHFGDQDDGRGDLRTARPKPAELGALPERFGVADNSSPGWCPRGEGLSGCPVDRRRPRSVGAGSLPAAKITPGRGRCPRDVLVYVAATNFALSNIAGDGGRFYVIDLLRSGSPNGILGKPRRALR
jgi:hypothetical protein